MEQNVRFRAKQPEDQRTTSWLATPPRKEPPILLNNEFPKGTSSDPVPVKLLLYLQQGEVRVANFDFEVQTLATPG